LKGVFIYYQNRRQINTNQYMKRESYLSTNTCAEVFNNNIRRRFGIEESCRMPLGTRCKVLNLKIYASPQTPILTTARSRDCLGYNVCRALVWMRQRKHEPRRFDWRDSLYILRLSSLSMTCRTVIKHATRLHCMFLRQVRHTNTMSFTYVISHTILPYLNANTTLNKKLCPQAQSQLKPRTTKMWSLQSADSMEIEGEECYTKDPLPDASKLLRNRGIYVGYNTTSLVV